MIAHCFELRPFWNYEYKSMNQGNYFLAENTFPSLFLGENFVFTKLHCHFWSFLDHVSHERSTPWGVVLQKPPSSRMDSVSSAHNLVAKHPTDAQARLASLGRFRKRPSYAWQWKPSRGWCTARCPSDTWFRVSDGQKENHQSDTSQSVWLMVFTRVRQSKKGSIVEKWTWRVVNGQKTIQKCSVGCIYDLSAVKW
jgi:hypothetical protein